MKPLLRTIAIWMTGMLASGLFGLVATSHLSSGPDVVVDRVAGAALGALPFAFSLVLLSPRGRFWNVALWFTGLPASFYVAAIAAEVVSRPDIALEAGIAGASAFAFFMLLAVRETNERVGKFARVAAIWITGLLASGIWGGLAGFLVVRSNWQVFGLAGCVGGVMAFACIRLWLREKA